MYFSNFWVWDLSSVFVQLRDFKAEGSHLPTGLYLLRALRGFKCFEKICNCSEVVSNCNHLDLIFHFFFPDDSIFFLLALPLPFCFLSSLFLPFWVKFLAPGLFARKETTACKGDLTLSCVLTALGSDHPGCGGGGQLGCAGVPGLPQREMPLLVSRTPLPRT